MGRADCSELRKGTEGRVGETEALRRLGALAFKPKHHAIKTRPTKPIKKIIQLTCKPIQK